MKAEDLKAGQKAEMIHCRKGTILGVVKDNDPKSEWISFYLLEPVKGLVNEWVKGEELTCRKSFLSSIKVFDVPQEKVIFPIEKWGKDHWGMLTYCETRAVDYDGVLDLKHIRVNVQKRGFSNGAGASTDKWNPDYATRTKDGNKPSKSHDDIDVMDDLQREGFLDGKMKGGEIIIMMTDYGNDICSKIRQHKAAGKNFNEFSLPKQVA